MKETGDMLRKHCRVFYGVDSTTCVKSISPKMETVHLLTRNVQNIAQS